MACSALKYRALPASKYWALIYEGDGSFCIKNLKTITQKIVTTSEVRWAFLCLKRSFEG